MNWFDKLLEICTEFVRDRLIEFKDGLERIQDILEETLPKVVDSIMNLFK